MKTSVAFVASCLFACGCTNPQDFGQSDRDYLTESSVPRKGDTIKSKSVDPKKMYWGARSIKLLKDVGYLSQDEADVADRADGIIVNTAPNGRIGVDELAILESPEHIGTLFPEEKTVIAKLWKILLIEDAPLYKAQDVSDDVKHVDTYTVQPVHYPIQSLPSDLQKTAKRVELNHDGDGNATTISGHDLEAASYDNGSYLPAEVGQFYNIATVIAWASPVPEDVQRLEVAAESTQTVLDGPSITIHATIGYAIVGTELQGSAKMNVGAIDPTTTMIALNTTTGADQKLEGSGLNSKHRIELWKGGKRLVQVDADTGSIKTMPIPYGYAVKIGATFYHWWLDANQLVSYKTATWPYLPSYNRLHSASYYVRGKPHRVDVLANGRVVIFDGASLHACNMHTNYYLSQYSYSCSVSLDGYDVSLSMMSAEPNVTPLGLGMITLGNYNYALMPY